MPEAVILVGPPSPGFRDFISVTASIGSNIGAIVINWFQAEYFTVINYDHRPSKKDSHVRRYAGIIIGVDI